MLQVIRKRKPARNLHGAAVRIPGRFFLVSWKRGRFNGDSIGYFRYWHERKPAGLYYGVCGGSAGSCTEEPLRDTERLRTLLFAVKYLLVSLRFVAAFRNPRCCGYSSWSGWLLHNRHAELPCDEAGRKETWCGQSYGLYRYRYG